MPVRVFFSYCQKDEALFQELAVHLDVLQSNGTIAAWHSRKVAPGEERRATIDRELEAADLVLLLVSADFLASEYRDGAEVRRALERQEVDAAQVVPVVLRPCLWEEAKFGKLEPLPRGGRPITRWEDRDEAWLDVARGVRDLARRHRPPEARAMTRGVRPSSRDMQLSLIDLEVPRSMPSVVADRAEVDEPRTLEVEKMREAAEALRRSLSLDEILEGEKTAPVKEGPPKSKAASIVVRPEVEQWLRELETAQAEKDAALRRDEDVRPIQARIDELKHRLRKGGQLQQNDSLGDGRYFLLRPLGRGGFATVWEADDRKEGKRVAIKVLHPQLAADAARRERFFRGARAMARLDHPNVVRVLVPYEEDAGFFYFVMELVKGGDLHRAVLEKRVERSKVVPLVLQVGDALAVAHEAGFVHRDVSPHNVLLGEGGEAQLSDFDLVAAEGTTGGTRTGAMGKFLYAAPEVMSRPQDADARADVFALGMTAIFCLHGADLPTNVIRRPEQLLAKLDCGPLAPVLQKSIEWEAEDRYPNVRAFCEALRAASQRAVLEPPVDLFGSLARPPGRPSDLLEWTPSEPSNVQPSESVPEQAAVAPVAGPAVQQATVQAVKEAPPGPPEVLESNAIEEVPTARSTSRRTALWIGGTLLALVASGGAVTKLWPRDDKQPSPMSSANQIVTASIAVNASVAPSGSVSAAPSASTSVTPSATVLAMPSPCPPDMAFIAAGTFRMGSDDDDKDAGEDEKPAHDVTLSAFCIDVTEVTVASYRQCTKEAKNELKCLPAPTTVQWPEYGAAEVKRWSQFCNGDRSDRDQHPLNCVDWKRADTYCKWAGRALPTEAQWEFAARGKERRKYPWASGEVPGPTLLNACGSECREMGKKKFGATWTVIQEGNDGAETTAPVKSYAKGATPEGVYDMAGNVWEWMQNTKAEYSAAPAENPLQINHGPLRALRGGGWLSDTSSSVRAAARNELHAGIRLDNGGFRCALTLKQ